MMRRNWNTGLITEPRVREGLKNGTGSWRRSKGRRQDAFKGPLTLMARACVRATSCPASRTRKG